MAESTHVHYKEEKANAMSHYVAYSGPFHVEMENGKPKLCHSMSVSLFPGWLGDTQERSCSLEGDVLKLSTPPMLTNGVVAKPVLTWKKMSSTS